VVRNRTLHDHVIGMYPVRGIRVGGESINVSDCHYLSEVIVSANANRWSSIYLLFDSHEHCYQFVQHTLSQSVVGSLSLRVMCHDSVHTAVYIAISHNSQQSWLSFNTSWTTSPSPRSNASQKRDETQTQEFFSVAAVAGWGYLTFSTNDQPISAHSLDRHYALLQQNEEKAADGDEEHDTPWHLVHSDPLSVDNDSTLHDVGGSEGICANPFSTHSVMMAFTTRTAHDDCKTILQALNGNTIKDLCWFYERTWRALIFNFVESSEDVTINIPCWGLTQVQFQPITAGQTADTYWLGFANDAQCVASKYDVHTIEFQANPAASIAYCDPADEYTPTWRYNTVRVGNNFTLIISVFQFNSEKIDWNSPINITSITHRMETF